jgi:hypothetical protein
MKTMHKMNVFYYCYRFLTLKTLCILIEKIYFSQLFGYKTFKILQNFQSSRKSNKNFELKSFQVYGLKTDFRLNLIYFVNTKHAFYYCSKK